MALNSFSGIQPVLKPQVGAQYQAIPGVTSPAAGVGVPPIAGAAVNPISGQPGENLRGQAITPGADPRLQQTQGQVDTTAGKVAAGPNYSAYVPQNGRGDPYTTMATDALRQAMSGVGSGGGGAPSALLSATRDRTTGALDELTQGANRNDLAAKAFDLLVERSQPGFEQDQRRVGQLASAFGRTGAGMTTNELTDLSLAREKALGQSRRDLGLEAAAGDIQDRFNRVGAINQTIGTLSNDEIGRGGLALSGSRLAGDLAGQAFGFGQALRGEGRQDANMIFDREQAGYNDNLRGLGSLSGLEQQQFGQGLTGREELRGERGYQDALENQAYGRRIDQLGLERTETGFQDDRRNQNLDELYRLGFQGNPEDAYQSYSDRYANEGNQSFGDAAGLIGEYARRTAQQGGGPIPPAPYVPPLRPGDLPRPLTPRDAYSDFGGS